MMLYRLLLHLYPASFRAEYGAEMCAVFAARRRTENRFTLWPGAVCDVLINALSVHADLLRQDLRWALRTTFHSPGFPLTVMLLIALGVGANTAVFGLVDAVLLRSLPVERPQELAFIHSAGVGGIGVAPPYPYLARLRDEASSFTGLAAFAADELRIEVDGTAEQVFGQVASGSFFNVLGVRPVAGRLLTRDDEKLDPPVAVIGYGYWQRRFGGSPDAIGQTVSFGGRTYTIVGVTPAPFRGLHPGRQLDLTLPITASGLLQNSSARWFDLVARLRPEVSIERGTAEANAVFNSFLAVPGVAAQPWRKSFDHVELRPAGRGLGQLRSRFSIPLVVLTAAAGVVLLIACANLVNLLTARNAARSSEFAIRLAVGANSRRLLRQLVTETMLHFAAGGIVGLAIAWAAIRSLTELFAVGRNPILLDARFDWRLAGFAACAVLIASLLTSLWPTLRARHNAPQAAMKQGGTRLAGSRQEGAAGRFLVIGQAGLSFVVLVSAVMFSRTMLNLRATELGFTGEGVVTMSLDPLIPGDDAGYAREQFWERALARVRALPGVRAASLSVLTPLSGRDTGKEITVPGYEPRSREESTVRLNHVSEGYFETFGIRLLAGRTFTARDAKRAPRVAIVSETAAKTYFPDRNPIGQTIGFGEAGGYQVIGIVQDHKHKSVREEAARIVFVPVWQPLERNGRITLAISAGSPPLSIAGIVAREVRATHPDALISDVIEAPEQIDATLLSERLLARLATTFAALTLVLAAIGLYGVLSYSVARRRAELGIRAALGASRARIAWSVVRQVLLQVTTGIGIGLPVAAGIARMAERLLFGIQTSDAGNYVFSASALAITAALAAWLPVRRACSIAPTEALRGN